MGNVEPSFINEEDRGSYARELRSLVECNDLPNWYVYPSVKTHEVCIEPKSGTYKEFLWENVYPITRISIEIKDGQYSFGVSGYQSFRIKNTREKFEEKEYKYHDKGLSKDGKRLNGRWWLTKRFDNLESIAKEMKQIEPLLLVK